MNTIMTTGAAVLEAAHEHVGWGWGWGWGGGWFLLIPLFWIIVLGLVFAFAGRRWRRAAWAERTQGARSAESTLAERFAQGDIDETEYRARLEVLRANRPDAGGR